MIKNTQLKKDHKKLIGDCSGPKELLGSLFPPERNEDRKNHHLQYVKC